MHSDHNKWESGAKEQEEDQGQEYLRWKEKPKQVHSHFLAFNIDLHF